MEEGIEGRSRGGRGGRKGGEGEREGDDSSYEVILLSLTEVQLHMGSSLRDHVSSSRQRVGQRQMEQVNLACGQGQRLVVITLLDKAQRTYPCDCCTCMRPPGGRGVEVVGGGPMVEG